MNSFASFQSFLDNTSLHGWGHLGHRKGTKHDKFIWLLTIIGSSVAGVILLGKVVREFQNATVKMNLESSRVDVAESVFPQIVMKNSYRIRS